MADGDCPRPRPLVPTSDHSSTVEFLSFSCSCDVVELNAALRLQGMDPTARRDAAERGSPSACLTRHMPGHEPIGRDAQAISRFGKQVRRVDEMVPGTRSREVA
jgi:hypothetical protein